MKILSVVNSAYRATIEEQDDTILWISTALKGQGADITVLLRGNAVNYGVKGQDASGLRFGDEQQTQPPKLEQDVARLIGKGVPVLVVEDDLADRGIESDDLIDGLDRVTLAEITKVYDAHQLIWNW